MLVAFNSAPGTVAPEEPGPYGVYAQSLAEMIRTGGLPLPELFNRVRLRVNENTKGALVPWDTQKVDAQFMFFDRAPDAPAQAPPGQIAAFRDKPIRDLGAQDAYAAALDRDTLQGYEDFLAAYPQDPLAKRVRAIVAARREAITWRRTYRADTPDAYWSYLQRYPRGPHAADARRRLAILSAAIEPPPTFTVLEYDVPPPPPDEIVYVDRPVLMFSDPDFDFAPPPPPPVYYLPPPPEDFVVLEPPPPPIGLFYLPQPLFVPIPDYVSSPEYVSPPPDNIIYNNIHNTTVINNVINRPPARAPLTRQWPPSAQGGTAPSVSPGAKGALGRAVCDTDRRRSSAAARGRAKGLADPARKTAGAAERLDQSGEPGSFRHRLVGKGADDAVARKCIPQRAASGPRGAEGQRPAGPGHERGLLCPPGATGPVPGAPNPNAKLAPGQRRLRRSGRSGRVGVLEKGRERMRQHLWEVSRKLAVQPRPLKQSRSFRKRRDGQTRPPPPPPPKPASRASRPVPPGRAEASAENSTG